MDFVFNKRGNLIRPASRFLHLLQSVCWSAAITYVLSYVNGFDVAELFSSELLVGFTVLTVLALGIISWFSKDLEFDDARKCVVQGRKVIVKYSEIYQVEIRRGKNDGAGEFRVCLRVGATRVYDLFYTNSETDASLNAAAVARAVGKSVVLTNGRGDAIAA